MEFHNDTKAQRAYIEQRAQLYHNRPQVIEAIAELVGAEWNVPGKTSLFYTNRDHTDILWGQKVASSIREQSDFVTIGGTDGGRVLENLIETLGLRLNQRDVHDLWTEASRLFALAAKGDVAAMAFEGTLLPTIKGLPPQDPDSKNRPRFSQLTHERLGTRDPRESDWMKAGSFKEP